MREAVLTDFLTLGYTVLWRRLVPDAYSASAAVDQSNSNELSSGMGSVLIESG
ncbi:hypothetical protein GCM10025857_02680 [Alicyclobacillus contaminans]|nr:hypothetical protein GCM10025857_02680 [Alicyclobacillus contaminans]